MADASTNLLATEYKAGSLMLVTHRNFPYRETMAQVNACSDEQLYLLLVVIRYDRQRFGNNVPRWVILKPASIFAVDLNLTVHENAVM